MKKAWSSYENRWMMPRFIHASCMSSESDASAFLGHESWCGIWVVGVVTSWSGNDVSGQWSGGNDLCRGFGRGFRGVVVIGCTVVVVGGGGGGVGLSESFLVSFLERRFVGFLDGEAHGPQFGEPLSLDGGGATHVFLANGADEFVITHVIGCVSQSEEGAAGMQQRCYHYRNPRKACRSCKDTFPPQC